MHDLSRLEVHDDALDLAVSVHRTTERFPRRETFGLTSQMRRAAGSISSNIAEGAGRDSPRDFSRFLAMAQGSLSELRSQSQLAARLGFIGAGERDALVESMSTLGRRLRRLREWLDGQR